MLPPSVWSWRGDDTKHPPHRGCVTEVCTSVWHLACPEAKLKFIVCCSATNDLQSTASSKATDDPSDKAGSESGKTFGAFSGERTNASRKKFNQERSRALQRKVREVEV